MMYPILCKVRYETLHRTFRAKKLWIQVAFSVVVNWIVAPFFMVGLPNEFFFLYVLTADIAGPIVGISS